MGQCAAVFTDDKCIVVTADGIIYIHKYILYSSHKGFTEQKGTE